MCSFWRAVFIKPQLNPLDFSHSPGLRLVPSLLHTLEICTARVCRKTALALYMRCLLVLVLNEKNSAGVGSWFRVRERLFRRSSETRGFAYVDHVGTSRTSEAPRCGVLEDNLIFRNLITRTESPR